MRKLNVNDKVIEYSIGKSHVKIRFMNGTSISPSFTDIIGVPKELAKGTAITPADIRAYIEREGFAE